MEGRHESLEERIDRELEETLHLAAAGNKEERQAARSLLARKYRIDRAGFKEWLALNGSECQKTNTMRLREKYRRG